MNILRYYCSVKKYTNISFTILKEIKFINYNIIVTALTWLLKVPKDVNYFLVGMLLGIWR